MNNKHKLKRIKWGTLITITCLIGIILLNTNAKSLNSSKAQVKKVANTTCKIATVFDPNIAITKNKDTNSATVSINTTKNPTANFWVFIAYGLDRDGNVRYIVDNKDFKGNYEKNDISLYAPYTEIYAVIVYRMGDYESSIEGCGATTYETAKDIATDFVKNQAKFSDAIKSTINEKNYAAMGGYSAYEISDDEVETNPILNMNNLAKLLEKMKEVFSRLSDYTEKVKQSDDYDKIKAPSEGKVSNTDLGTLTCSKNDVYKVGEGTNAGYLYTNKNEYYYEETKQSDDGKCETTCKEAITVEYGPPVATKAGMCFEYRVKVQSKVACKSEWKGGDAPTPEPLCDVYPICNQSANWSSQAGPDEEFDSCINKCDSGKYSQKCINKCYKEVYENVNNKKISYDDALNNSSSATLLTNFKHDYTWTDAPFCNNSNNPADYSDNFEELKKAMRNSKCEYQRSGDKIIWNCARAYNNNKYPDAKQWVTLGRYYFINDKKAIQTVQSIADSCTGEIRSYATYKYYIDKYGFKRACYSRDGKTEETCTNSCEEVCSWHLASGQYDRDTGKNKKNCTLSKTERDTKYETELSNYENARKACQAQASCSENQAVFTINVKDKSSTVDTGTTNFRADIKNTNGLKQVVNILNNISPILDRSGCYGDSDKTNYYMTEWSFPGSWVSNKRGTIVHKEPEDTSGWQEKTNKFCISDNTSVNSKWYKWVEDIKLDNETSYKNEKYTGTEKIDYNIKASTKNFGYFAWNVNIQCFYATPESQDTGHDAHDTRSVDDNDLFPDESRTIENSSGNTEKIIGFNWTADARENLYSDINYTTDQDKSTTYEIDPPALISDIEKGDTYSSANLEYEFTLNREKLNKLKKLTIGEFNGKFIPHKVGKKATKKGEKSKEYTIMQYQTDLLLSHDEYGGTRIRDKFCNNWDNNSCVKYSG